MPIAHIERGQGQAILVSGMRGSRKIPLTSMASLTQGKLTQGKLTQGKLTQGVTEDLCIKTHVVKYSGNFLNGVCAKRSEVVEI